MQAKIKRSIVVKKNNSFYTLIRERKIFYYNLFLLTDVLD